MKQTGTTSKRISLTIALSTISVLFYAQNAWAIEWETQAERLQLVSAAMLDAEPLLTPIESKWYVGLRSVVSALPKTNATVGGKTEQPPQPPVHAVPTLELGSKYDFASRGDIHARAWAGYLPGSASKATGMNAAARQTLGGIALGAGFDLLYAGSLETDIGTQVSKTEVEGAITEADAHDRFDVNSRIDFASLTFSPKRLRHLWMQAQVAQRTVQSRFEIPKDATLFEYSDESRIAKGSGSTQVAVGYSFQNGVSLAAGFLNVPDRVSMPRVLLGYNIPVGKLSFAPAAKADHDSSSLYAERSLP